MRRFAGDIEAGYGYNANELEDFEVTSWRDPALKKGGTPN